MSGIYIHIPFCKQACFYCDFHFSTLTEGRQSSKNRKNTMIKAIVEEIVLRKDEISNPIETIYFGGGTPSLLSIDEIQIILNTIYKYYTVIENPEITLEANPDDLSSKKIIELASSSINRLSIGVQSFFEEDLKFMNRAHSAKEALESLSHALRYFDNITIDLIYGVPNMSKEKWQKNLQIAFDLEVPHISSYALTVEDKTALSIFIKNGKYPPLDENLAEAHFRILLDETLKKNYIQYEISNFGKSGYFSKHNTSYWQGKHYLGIGPSAHSYNGINRSWNVANNAKYIKSLQEGIRPFEEEILTKKDRFNETIMTGLRTIWGIALAHIEVDFGKKTKDDLIHDAQKYLQNKTLEIREESLIVTDKGKFLIDGIAADLFLI